MISEMVTSTLFKIGCAITERKRMTMHLFRLDSRHFCNPVIYSSSMTPMKIVAMTTEKKIEKSLLKTEREIKQSPKDQLWEWEDNIVKDGRDMTLQFSGLDQF